MAFFGVTIEKLSEINKHPNADRLAIAKMAGLSFSFVIPKDQYTVGESVIYFPVDSLLPESILSKIGLLGKLSGKNRNRVKTLKLRGEISMGIVAKLDLLPEALRSASSAEITASLGVTKYEPPVVMENNASLKPLQHGCSTYDIEGADRNQPIIDLLMDEEVVVSEKMEGTNFSAGQAESEYYVNQRNHMLEELPGKTNSYCEAARKARLPEIFPQISRHIALYSELCGPGIQKNVYELTKHELFPFEMKIDGQWVDYEVFAKVMQDHFPHLRPAPILFVGKLRDFLKGRSVQEASNGPSLINPKILREGIVIRLLKQSYHPSFGRLIIKQRSPEYLSGEQDD